MACVADIDDVLHEKRTEKASLKLSGTLKALGQECATRNGTSFNDFTLTILARECAAQGLLGTTWSDLADLELTLLRALAIARSMKMAGMHQRRAS